MIYGCWYCICIREYKKKEKKNRYLVHFHSCSEGQPESLVDDVPRVLKQRRVLGGRIWKICGICQHLTILSRQYSSCLIEKCVLNCRNLFFFSWRTLFFILLPMWLDVAKRPLQCREVSGRMAQKTSVNTWEHHTWQQAQNICQEPHWERTNILAKTTKDKTTHFKGKSLLAKMLRS